MTEAPPAKRKFPRASALAVVRELLVDLKPACEKIVVAGSLRRGKPAVGDIEFLCIPKMVKVPDPEDFFEKLITVNAVDQLLAKWLADGTLSKRLSSLGRPAWGAANKLAVHGASEIPIDFFSTEARSWFNYLVCRTGPAESNTAIASAAQERGWKWNPYGEGFTRKPSGAGPDYHDVATMGSEREVFQMAGLDYREPRDRE